LSEKSKAIKDMADLLRQGATLTELSCPACASPLFKLSGGELWCAQCQKQVVVVREGETSIQAAKPFVMSTLESTILEKISYLEEELKKETDVGQLRKLSIVLSELLENLEKIKRLKSR